MNGQDETNKTAINSKQHLERRMFGFRTIDYPPRKKSYNRKKIERLHVAYTDKCKCCKGNLISGQTLIPVSEHEAIVIRGRVCHVCDILYVPPFNRGNLINALYYNQFAEHFTLNGERASAMSRRIENERFMAKFTKDERVYLDRSNFQSREEWLDQIQLASIPSSLFMLNVTYGDGKRAKYVIVFEPKDTNPKEGVLFYASYEARFLLTLKFCDQCRSGLSPEERQIDVQVISKVGTKQQNNPVIQQQLLLHAEGGYHSFQYDGEIVDALLYAPKTNMLECVPVTCINNEYCMDIKRFRDFVDRYGNPGISLYYATSPHDESDYGDLKTRSVLMEYGYSVNKNAKLTSIRRQSILAEIVDYQILSVSEIVEYLNFFIGFHSSDAYKEARRKWREDKDFISRYKAKPTGFVILGVR